MPKKILLYRILPFLFVLIFWSSFFVHYKEWRRNHIEWDIVSYYGYLPAIYIYHDLSLDFAVENTEFFDRKYWPEVTPIGKRVIKTSMGLSYLYTPFFLIGNHIAKTFHIPATGYSTPYQVSLLFGALFYLMLGLFYLRKLLLKFFSETTTFITLICIYFGTNLAWYSTWDMLMPHVYLFSLLPVYLLLLISWHDKPTLTRTIGLGVLLGLLALIRPTMILLVIPSLLYGIKDMESLKDKMKFIRKYFFFILLFPIAFLIPWIPQLIYWHNQSGSWLYYSYTGEKFYWNNPHILEGLFGFRKGWLIYTPIMIFAMAGLFVFKQNAIKLRSGTVVLLIVSIYVFFSWWSWWYGGSFGQRAMVDLYGLLAIPFASFVEFVFSKKKLFRFLFLGAACMLILLNIFQSWQFLSGLIHFDSMNGEAYRMIFLKKTKTPEWNASLTPPDYARAFAGKTEFAPASRPGRRPLHLEDFEIESQVKDYNSGTIVESGKYSCRLSNTTQRNPSFEYANYDIMQRQIDSLFVSASDRKSVV
jgi:hypothetical protein